MPALADILRKFRFPGVPGAPAATPVPVERAQGLEAELAPVFSVLEPVQRHAAGLVETAIADATRRREEAHAYADRLLTQARVDAAAARAEAAAERLVRAEEEVRAILAAADDEAARIASVSAQRIPELVDELVRRVLALGEGALGDGGAPSTGGPGPAPPATR